MEEKKHSRFKTIFYSIILVLFIGISLVNCSRDETEDENYYVKYEVNSTTIYSEGKLNVQVNDVNNQKSNFVIKTKTPWDITVGPVKKGFEASINVSEASNNYGRLTLQTKISVSKNNAPFAIKYNDDSSTPRAQVQSRYVIDF